MIHIQRMLKGVLILTALLVLSGCGDAPSADTPETPVTPDTPVTPQSPTTQTDAGESNTSSTPISYRGLQFYYTDLAPADYALPQMSDADFNALTDEQQVQVADTLLTSLFYGYPLPTLQAKIAQGHFLSTLHSDLETDRTDKAWLESYILDDTVFHQYTRSWYQPQVLTILTRFYAMHKLDRYFLQNWMAYILTQTIMFSPAYELSSTHTPNIASVYNRLVTMFGTGAGMRYMTYVHMSSEDNWRRFRSPEDNGREMMEIYLQDTDDRHVPLAGKALQNWKLNTDYDTLEVGLNRNTTPLSLFGTTVYTGDDFYRELVKSDAFTRGVTRRLVDFFFPEKSATRRGEITATIVTSHPETWQDILLQILFSKEYLLHNTRPRSAEETFYSLARKSNYRVRRSQIYSFKRELESMHQASMKYKLGKLDRVPLDTLSFAYYHKFIRETMLIRRADPEETDRDSWRYYGWQDDFIGFDRFAHDESDPFGSLAHLVDYLFQSIAGRKATADEQAFFLGHMKRTDDRVALKDEFNMFTRRDDPEDEAARRERNKREIAIVVLDYLSRLDATYRQREVQ